ncbi:hypothetical protein ColTof4_06471 [Colletotrichum tofieldiae]|nr:hypothetical protein ColTof3_01666 [Colletotrichum tofieldiae]GKT74048.1 hypothetical protein ColTof4_06471 [Colletotrichum tofieldiae]
MRLYESEDISRLRFGLSVQESEVKQAGLRTRPEPGVVQATRRLRNRSTGVRPRGIPRLKPLCLPPSLHLATCLGPHLRAAPDGQHPALLSSSSQGRHDGFLGRREHPFLPASIFDPRRDGVFDVEWAPGGGVVVAKKVIVTAAKDTGTAGAAGQRTSPGTAPGSRTAQRTPAPRERPNGRSSGAR